MVIFVYTTEYTASYTARRVHAGTRLCTRPRRSLYMAVYTASRVYGRPCTRPCTRHVHGRKRPCTWPVHSRVHGPYTRAVCTVRARPCIPVDTARTRPCTRQSTRDVAVYRRIHGRFPPCKQPQHGVYTARIHVRTYTRPYAGRVHSTRLCTRTQYTAMYTAGTRPCIGRVHVPCTGPCTRHVHNRRRPCTRSIHSREHGRCT